MNLSIPVVYSVALTLFYLYNQLPFSITPETVLPLPPMFTIYAMWWRFPGICVSATSASEHDLTVNATWRSVRTVKANCEVV